LTLAEPGPTAGDLVHLSGGALESIGYVESVSEPAADGVRVITGRFVAPTSTTVRTADGVAVRPADPQEVADLLGGTDPRLHMGHAVGVDAAPVGLLAKRLNRHTFWCGQSGSGKTYALGVFLERVLSATRLPVVVLDPNSDFVGLGQVRPGVPPEEAEAHAARNVVVLRPDDPESPLRIRFTDFSPRAKAAVLRLDPVADRGEYNALLRLASQLRASSLTELGRTLRELKDPDGAILAQRIENLGLLGWTQTWAGAGVSATDVIAERPAAVVLDMGGYDRHEEQLTVALGVLEDLWARRTERRPVLLVLDEAHNFASPDAETPLAAAVRDRIVQIAAEGRKYGLWLLLSTQRPNKIHPGVLTQCDNLTLMRMNSPADLAELAAVFGFVPTQLLDRAARFIQGEALMAGGFVPLPTVVKVRDRITPEGGVDVPVPMAD
jgi:DNA helicase HerA-like ATPase